MIGKIMESLFAQANVWIMDVIKIFGVGISTDRRAKAAWGCRTPQPCGRSWAYVSASASWSAEAPCRFREETLASINRGILKIVEIANLRLENSKEVL